MVPRLHQETNEQIGEDFRMIPLTHVVPIVPVPGGVHQPLVQPQVQVQVRLQSQIRIGMITNCFSGAGPLVMLWVKNKKKPGTTSKPRHERLRMA